MNTKRILALVLSLCMIFSLAISGTAFAEGEDDYVVQIGENKYTSLSDASEAVQTGETIILLKDYTVNSEEDFFFLENSVSCVFDMAGHSIIDVAQSDAGNGPFFINDGSFTLTGNGSITQAYAAGSWSGVWVENGSFTMLNGTITAIDGRCVQVEQGSASIQGGTLNATAEGAHAILSEGQGASVAISGGTFNIAEGANAIEEVDTINITGGTFNGDGDLIGDNTELTTVTGATFSEALAENLNDEQKQDNTIGSSTPVEPTYVAHIGEQGYASLAEAFAAAEGTTCTIVLDKSIENNTYIEVNYATSTDVTLDLNGNTITDTSNVGLVGIYSVGTVLRIKDSAGGGKISGVYSEEEAACICALVSGVSVYVQSGTIEATAANGAKAVSCIYNSGATVVVNGGTLIANGGATTILSHADDSSVTQINSGTFIADSASTAIMSDCGGVEIKSGTFSGEGNLLGQYDDTDVPALTISGGNFEAINVNLDATGEDSEVAVSGGTFSEEVDEKYLAEGYELKENNGTYGVQEAESNSDPVAYIGETGYASLEAAFAAAQTMDSATITLADDAYVEECIEMTAGNITLNFNGHDITDYTDDGAFWIQGGSLKVTGEGMMIGEYANAGAACFYMTGGALTLEGDVILDVAGQNGDAQGVFLNEGGTLTVYDNAVINANSEDDRCIYNSGGTVIIYGGTFNVLGGGAAILQDGTAPDTTVNGGEFFVADEGAVLDASTGEVSIEGGIFEWNPGYEASDKLSVSSASIAISGGSFTTEVPENYLAEGYELKDNGNGTYGVQEEAPAALNGYYKATMTFKVMGMFTNTKYYELSLTNATEEAAKSAIADRFANGMGSSASDVTVTALEASTQEAFEACNAHIDAGNGVVIGTSQSFAEILNFAADGDTVKLNKDLETGNAGVMNIDGAAQNKSVTVDMNGHDLTDTNSGSSAFSVSDGCGLALTGTGTVIVADGHDMPEEVQVAETVTVQMPTPAPVTASGYFKTSNADIRSSLMWNVYFAIDNYDTLENPVIAVSCTADPEISKDYQLTYDAEREAYYITVPVRHRLIDETISFTLKDNNGTYKLGLGQNGEKDNSVEYSFNRYLDKINSGEYATVVTAIRAYRDALLSVWPLNG